MTFVARLASLSVRNKLMLMMLAVLFVTIFVTLHHILEDGKVSIFESFVLCSTVFLTWSFLRLVGDIFFTKPINQLIKMAERLGIGTLSMRTGIQHSDTDEIGMLAKSFDRMAELLEERSMENARVKNELAMAVRENERILNSVEEGIIGINHEGKIYFVNKSVQSILEYAPEDLIGFDLHTVVHHTHPDGVPYTKEDCAILKCCHGGECVRIKDDMFWKKNKTLCPVVYSVTPVLENSKVIGSVITFRDVSSRRKIEQALKDSQAMVRAITDTVDRLLNCITKANSDPEFWIRTYDNYDCIYKIMQDLEDLKKKTDENNH